MKLTLLVSSALNKSFLCRQQLNPRRVYRIVADDARTPPQKPKLSSMYSLKGAMHPFLGGFYVISSVPR
jgi:hypothetical protein